jgi:sensor domain CHASE-containing protein
MDNKPVKDWIIKVQDQVDDELNIRRKMGHDINTLVVALEDVVETLTQNDPRWNKLSCIRDAKAVLREIRGY